MWMSIGMHCDSTDSWSNSFFPVYSSFSNSFFTYFNIFTLAIVGGTLGVLLMVPLRRSLIVKEHGTLPYPEGTACADVLVAGERGGSFAGNQEQLSAQA